MNGLKSEPLPIPCSHLLKQAVSEVFCGIFTSVWPQSLFTQKNKLANCSQLSFSSQKHCQGIGCLDQRTKAASLKDLTQPSCLSNIYSPVLILINKTELFFRYQMNIYRSYILRKTSQSFSLRISQGQSQHSPLIDHS